MNVSIPTGATPTKVLTWGNRRSAVLQNNSGSDIYLGGDDVTSDAAATGGYILKDGQSLAMSNGGGADSASGPVYAVHAEAGTLKLVVWEI